jgi:hypothetical protein
MKTETIHTQPRNQEWGEKTTMTYHQVLTVLSTRMGAGEPMLTPLAPVF